MWTPIIVDVSAKMKRASTATVERLRKLVEAFSKTKGIDRLYNKMRVVSGGEGNLHAELDVTEEMVNRYGGLHGGFTAVLIDATSTFALSTVSGGKMGVSTDLNVSYFRPAFENDTLVIQAKTLKCGKNLGVGTVDIIIKESGALVAQGRHTKFMPGTNLPENFTPE